MRLWLFVEDELCEGYTELARAALRHTAAAPTQIRTARVDPVDLTDSDSLKDLAERAHRAGYDCVVFIMDEELVHQSPGRGALLEGFRMAFEALCRHLARLPSGDPMCGMRVTRVVCVRCLESWLLADPMAIVDSVRGRHGVSYEPAGSSTEYATPRQALEQIAHHIRQVGQELGRRDLSRMRTGGLKVRAREIAQHVDPERARHNNYSLAYFYDMITCQESGCARPFPAPEA